MNDDEKAFFQQIEREQTVHDVNNEITLYQQTGDARFFWRAFLIIHESGDPIPKDFINKLAKFGEKLLQTKTPQELATALELTGDTKKHVGPKHSLAYEKRWRLASEVRTVKELYKISLQKAIEAVARNNNLSAFKVRKDYHSVFTAGVHKANKDAAATSLSSAVNAWR